EPLSFQWRFNGTNLPGAIGPNLILSNAQPTASGSYSLVITNASGSRTSSLASLTVRLLHVLVNGQSYAGSSTTLANGLPFQLALESLFPSGFIYYSLDGSNPRFGAFYS